MGIITSQESIINHWANSLQNFNLCLRPELQSEDLSNFTKQHNYISLYKDPYYGQCHVLQNIKDNSKCVVLKETLERKLHQTRIEELEQITICGEGPANRNIIKTEILADIEKTGFLWKKNELYIKHDYILFDLEKEFENRVADNNEFIESQIKTIIKECTKGLLRLQLSKYNSICMKYIYFCDDGSEIKVAHPKLFNYQSNLQILYEDYSVKNIYLSPEELQALQISDYKYQCGWSSNAFSFGMIILSLMTMKHLNDVYNYQACEIDFNKINELISVCSNRYSYHLINIVHQLLNKKEGQRLTFRNLYNKIDTNQIITNPVQLTLVNEQEKINMPLKDYPVRESIAPKYPNYIAALLKPKIGLNGEYMSLTNEEERTSYQAESIKANQRLRYSTSKQDYGNYIGETIEKDKSKNNEAIRQGKGVYQYKDGQTYIGDWKQGKMEGFGKLYFKDKKLRYEGEFKKGMFHGYGSQYVFSQIPDRQEEIDQEYVKIYTGNWIKYEGYYKFDIKDGAGKVYFKKGYWKGNFRNGQPNGQGIYNCYVTNQATKGTWKDGQLVNSI